ncbi:MAG: endonuclease/exonuclease/phosphatase family protein [Microthrixaceae bacterium]
MRVATYNIRHGAPPGRCVALGGTGAAVASLRADVVALQEVDRHVFRSWWRDQPRHLARAIGGSAHFAAARSLGPFGRYGNALLVRGEVQRERVLELPSKGEQRVALLLRARLGDERVTVVSTHLQNRRKGRPAEAPDQLDHLLRELQGWPTPWVLMGDLNLRADTVVPRLVDAGLTPVDTAATFPSDGPSIRIDWIAVRDLAVVSAQVPDLRASDHRPIVADLIVPGGGGHAPPPAPDEA